MYSLQLTLGLFFVLYRFRWVYDPALQDANEVRRTCRHPYCNFEPHLYIVKNRARRWFNAERHTRLEAKLMECGYAPWLAVPVAIVELLAGLGLIIGLWPKLCALGLLVILGAAFWKTGRAKIDKQGPVDVVDRISCALWLPEPLYMVMCLVILGGG